MGRIAIVTGGASGIGLALGRALVARGDHVVLADIDAEAADTEPILDKNVIPGLPTPPSMEGVSGRELARRSPLVRLYPADRLAEDVLRGIARDRAIIVAPRSARVVWRLWRLAPRLMLRLSVRETDRVRAEMRRGRTG